MTYEKLMSTRRLQVIMPLCKGGVDAMQDSRYHAKP